MSAGTAEKASVDTRVDVDVLEVPDVPEAEEVAWQPGWRSRPLGALVVAITANVLPLLLAVVVTLALREPLSVGAGLPGLVTSFALLAGVSFVVAETAQRLLQRLGSLALLLRLGLAFPAAAPSRFRVALRSGNSRLLDRPDAVRDRPPEQAAEAILALVSRLSQHDRATRGHSERVRAYTELIAEELGLSRAERHRIRWAGLVHDVGKLRTPAHILNKAGQLEADEWEIIKRHPLDGLELAIPLWPWLGRDVLAVSDHHERWDGDGYPSGAAGEEISRAGRIVAVADAFDVMTSARSYKRPISVESARAELVACAGGHFDPEVVRAFLAISVRRLRAIVGPVPAVVAFLGGPIARQEFPWIQNLAVAAAVAALALSPLVESGGDADEVLGKGPVAADTVPGPAGSSGGTATDIDEPSGGDDGLEMGSPDGLGPISTGGPTEAAPSPVRGRPVGQQTDQVEVRDPSGDPVVVPDDPSATPRDTADDDADDPSAPRGPGGDGASIVIDPNRGSVTLERVGSTDEIEVIEAPGTGPITCGEVGLCEPIEVPLPVGG